MLREVVSRPGGGPPGGLAVDLGLALLAALDLRDRELVWSLTNGIDEIEISSAFATRHGPIASLDALVTLLMGELRRRTLVVKSVVPDGDVSILEFDLEDNSTPGSHWVLSGTVGVKASEAGLDSLSIYLEPESRGARVSAELDS